MRKKVWIFCHYAQQPPQNTMLRYHNLGKGLNDKGCDVTIFAASVVHNTNYCFINNDDRYLQQDCEGIKYVYIKTRTYSGNGFQRVLNMIEYYCRVLRVTKLYEKPDLIIACSPHPLVAVAGIKIARKLHIPCISDILDLWPQSIIEYMGVSSRNPLIAVLFVLEKWIYRKSDAIIFSMEGGKQYIIDRGWDKYIDIRKVFYINNGLDLIAYDKNRTTVSIDNPELLRNDLFKVVYCGSVRTANNLKSVCDAALIIKKAGYSKIRFMIYGSGDQIEELQEHCKEIGVDTVQFYGRIQKEQIPYVLSHGDACFLSFKDVPLKKYGGSQQKSFEYYASGKPILSNWNSGYNLIKQYDCGIVTETQTAMELAEAVMRLYDMPAELRSHIGARGRQIAEDYALPILTEKLLKVLEYVNR